MNRPTAAQPDPAAASPAEDLSRALARIDAGERHSRRNVVIASVIPVVLGVALVAFTGHWVRKSAVEVRKLSTAKQQLLSETDSLREQNLALGAQARELEGLLSDTTEMSHYTRPVGFDDLKFVASSNILAGRILERVLRLREQNVKWHLGGRSPDEGFDSPGFATFVLRDLDLLPDQPHAAPAPGERREGAGRRPPPRRDAGNLLRERLPQSPDPRPGDLVLYESGYAMFYFRTPNAEPFVIGMTPFGITSLKTDFAKQLGVRRVGG